MTRTVALAAALAFLAACATTPVPVRQGPLDVHVLPECTQACTCDVKPSVITADPYEAAAVAVREHKLRKLCVEQCDTRRRDCAEAIDRARTAGAIK